MWALVRANRLQTALLVAVSLAVSVVIGYVLGRLAGMALGVGPRVEAGLVGVEVAIVVWILITVVTSYQGDALILAAAGAEPIEFKDHPQFCNVVEEMALAANLGRTPKPFVIHEQAMNAFATGIRPESTAIAVTAGALSRLNRDQLQGLVAHEIAKIAHGDVLFLSLVSLMTGAVFSRTSRRDTFSRNPRYMRGSAPMPAGQRLARALCGSLALFAPVYAVFIAMGVVRKRVYLADAAAALYTRYPEGLAGALHVISGDPFTLVHANRGIATLCTINPFKKEMGIHTPFLLGATHPPTKTRIGILRRIHSGVSLGAYQRAWQTETGAKGRLMPEAALKAVRPLPIRAGEHASETATGSAERLRATGDLVRRLHDYLFLGCACGMRIKLPPTYPRDHVGCPRCGRLCAVPTAALLTGAARAAAVEAAAVHADATLEGRDTEREAAARERALTAPPALVITRTTPGWMTFKCTCGTPNQLSPSFGAPNTVCPECKAKIAIVHAERNAAAGVAQA
jgi:heat shock protein HtpX